MARTDTILLGKVIKVNGVDGAVTIKSERTYYGEIPETGPVFLEIDGRPVPFFIISSHENGTGLIKMRFEDWDSFEKAREFQGCNVFVIRPSDPGKSRVKKGENAGLKGFYVENEANERIGTVSEIIENPGQLLLRVLGEGGRELLIPFHEDLIRRIDPENRKIIMLIPEGLEGLNG